MAFVDHNQGEVLPKRAASDLGAFQFVGADPGQENQVVRLGSSGQRPYGGTDQGSILRGEYGPIYSDGMIIKAIAQASIGAGAAVGVTGATTSLGLAAAASGAAVWSIGEAQTNVAAGERFSVLVKPRQLSGLV